MTEPLFLTVKQTADVLGVSDDCVYELTARGEIPCVEFGRRKMIPRLAVELVVERAMTGFDPDALVLRLAATGASSSAADSFGDGAIPGGAPPASDRPGVLRVGEAPGTAGRVALASRA